MITEFVPIAVFSAMVVCFVLLVAWISWSLNKIDAELAIELGDELSRTPQ